VLKKEKGEKLRMRKRREKVQCEFLVILLLFGLATVFVVPGFASSETRLYVDPSSVIDQALTPPKTFTVNVTLANVTNLFGFEYKLFWDPTLINLTSYTTYIPSGWEPPNGFSVKDDLSVPGRHWYSYTCLTGPSFTGDLTLTTYNFTVLSTGSCALDIQEDKLVDDASTLIPHTTNDGYFNNIPPAKLYVDRPSIVNPDLVPCKNFTVHINVSNAINLYSWEFKLFYSNDVLNATAVAEGSFLSASGPTNFVIIEFNDLFNATHGLVWVNCTFLAPPPVSGNGTLATISFHVEALGESVLDLADTALNDPWNVPIPHSALDGYFNNVLKAHLYVDPPSIIDPTLLPPSHFNVTIKVANITDLYDYQFKLGYDTAVLNCLGAIIIPFENETNFITQVQVDDEAGFVWVNVTYYSPAEPLTTTDPVTLAMVFFQVAAMGNTVLDLYDTRLSDLFDGDIPHDVSDGFVSIVERDVAVIAVALSSNMTYAGGIVYINVTVANEGDMVESFNVSTYYDGTLIETLPVIGLAPNTNKTLTSTWNTTGTTPCHNYTIKAEASVVPYETDTADNVYIDGKVKIKMLGDINGDGIIDIVDVVIVSLAFGSATEDDPETPWNETINWNPEADLNGDDIVDIVDLVIIGINFGKTC